MTQQSLATSSIPLCRCSRARFWRRRTEDGSIGTNSDDLAKATSLALSRPGDPLLDDLTAEVGVDQTPNGSFDSIHEIFVPDAVLPRKFRQCFGFENPHKSSLVL
jgi:hypothetical protein